MLPLKSSAMVLPAVLYEMCELHLCFPRASIPSAGRISKSWIRAHAFLSKFTNKAHSKLGNNSIKISSASTEPCTDPQEALNILVYKIIVKLQFYSKKRNLCFKQNVIIWECGNCYYLRRKRNWSKFNLGCSQQIQTIRYYPEHHLFLFKSFKV